MSMWDTLLSYGEDTLGPDRDWPLSEAERVWIDVWRFGIVVDDDLRIESLTGFWIDQDTGRSRATYYVPDEFDTEIPMVSIDTPPTVDVAWDARSL